SVVRLGRNPPLRRTRRQARAAIAATPLRSPYPPPATRGARGGTAFAVLAGASVAHLLNDTLQSLVPALYPMFKEAFALSFTQVGLMTLTLQLTASLLQPVIGLYTDRRPMPYSLVGGMAFTLAGVLMLSAASTFAALLVAAGLMGIGSSIFHPESSRIARMASGGRHGFAQSFFQVGGNLGSSFGPLLAAFLVVPRGQASVAWCAPLAVAAGTMLGGIVGDRIGVKNVIWASILGVFPFTALLPHATLFWTPILTICIGLVLASAFSAIVVYAQELVPGRVGMISGVFFGFAFGMAGLGAAILGQLADRIGIEAVSRLCAYLALIGLRVALL